MTPTSPVANATYVSFTTFTRDARPKPTPVWIAELGDGTLGFATGSTSYKVKRLRNNPDCTLQPCDSAGNVLEGSPVIRGSAEESRQRLPQVRRALRKKYGFLAIAWGGIAIVRGWFGTQIADTAIVVTLNPPPEV